MVPHSEPVEEPPSEPERTINHQSVSGRGASPDDALRTTGTAPAEESSGASDTGGARSYVELKNRQALVEELAKAGKLNEHRLLEFSKETLTEGILESLGAERQEEATLRMTDLLDNFEAVSKESFHG